MIHLRRPTMPAARPELAFPLSVVRRVGDPSREALVPLRIEDMMRTAERVTGLHDYGDDGGFRERLHRAFGSLMRIDWNLIGRIGVRTNLLWHLTNRLRLVDLLKRHPEVRDTPIDPPIVVLGLFRTGSTFLHNVLAEDSALRAGRNWEFSYPAGRPTAPFDDRTRCRAQAPDRRPHLRDRGLRPDRRAGGVGARLLRLALRRA